MSFNTGKDGAIRNLATAFRLDATGKAVSWGEKAGVVHLIASATAEDREKVAAIFRSEYKGPELDLYLGSVYPELRSVQKLPTTTESSDIAAVHLEATVAHMSMPEEPVATIPETQTEITHEETVGATVTQ